MSTWNDGILGLKQVSFNILGTTANFYVTVLAWKNYKQILLWFMCVGATNYNVLYSSSDYWNLKNIYSLSM